jgi:hypothetical protein
LALDNLDLVVDISQVEWAQLIGIVDGHGEEARVMSLAQLEFYHEFKLGMLSAAFVKI